MSSIKNNLGLKSNTEDVRDVNAKGMAALVTEARNKYKLPLNEKMIYDWHKMIFSTKTKISVGAWRSHSEPMQVISGSYGKEVVHFEAPPSELVPHEMQLFIQWFNDTAPGGSKEIKHAPVRCAIAHLYFETIHPFEDGNGRIGRVIAEKALLQSVGFPALLSLSPAIHANRTAYYDALKTGQRSNEITGWIIYFLKTIIKAFDNAEELIQFTLQKAKLFDVFSSQLNTRQIKVLKRMFQEGIGGFEGGMTAKKYMVIAKTSKATATRDIQKLNELGVFKSLGGGRSTSYVIKFN